MYNVNFAHNLFSYLLAIGISVLTILIYIAYYRRLKMRCLVTSLRTLPYTNTYTVDVYTSYITIVVNLHFFNRVCFSCMLYFTQDGYTPLHCVKSDDFCGILLAAEADANRQTKVN